MAERIKLVITKNATGVAPDGYKIDRSFNGTWNTLENYVASAGVLTYYDSGQNDSVGVDGGLPAGDYTYRAYGVVGGASGAVSTVPASILISTGCSQEAGNIWANQCFIDTDGDGRADGVDAFAAVDYTIVTGSGHTGNAQRATGAVGSSVAGGIVMILDSIPTNGTEYIVTFDFIKVGATAAGAVRLGTQVLATTSNSATINNYSHTFTASANASTTLSIFIGGSDDGAYVEISNFKIKKV